jgi:tRNA (guanine-N7-)-methyltransferase
LSPEKNEQGQAHGDIRAVAARATTTTRRQLLGINLCRRRRHHGFMGNDGRMHAQPGVEARPDTGVSAQRNAVGYPRTTSFRTRRAALSAAQQRTWERLWPELGTQARTADGPDEPLDIRAWFGREAPLVLEIGCGTGTSTLAMAQAEPDVDVIAVEVYRRGWRSCSAPSSGRTSPTSV